MAVTDLVRQSASCHGDGVFAQSVIAAGAHVLTMTGRVIDTALVTESMRAMQVGPSSYLVQDYAPGHDGSESIYLDNYLNHSCIPNLGFIHGDLRLFALRQIEPGQELTWDYSTSMNEPGWSLPCLCGSEYCRGRIQSFCDLSEQTRVQLLPMTLSYLR